MLAAGSGAKIVNFLLYSGLVLRMACACVYVQRASSVDNILPWEDTGDTHVKVRVLFSSHVALIGLSEKKRSLFSSWQVAVKKVRLY